MPKGNTYTPPDIALLDVAKNYQDIATTEAEMLSAALEARLADSGIHGRIVKISPHVADTCYYFKSRGRLLPFYRTRQSMEQKIRTIVRRTSPGAVVGVDIYKNKPDIACISVSNKIRYSLRMGDVISSPAFTEKNIPWAVGTGPRDQLAVYDLAKLSAVLVTQEKTGANTAFFWHTLIISLLYRFSPQQCRVVLINTTQAELLLWADIPHLVAPVARSANTAVSVLQSVEDEMESRYGRLKDAGAKDIGEYTGDNMPYLVVIVDELQHLMTDTNRAQAEDCICRIARQGKAVGIHLVVATRWGDIVTPKTQEAFSLRLSLIDNSEGNPDERWCPNIIVWDLKVSPSLVQTSYIDTAEIKRVTDFVRQYPTKKGL